MDRLARVLPGVEWLAGYNREALGADLLAAVIVTVMLIPQSLLRRSDVHCHLRGE